MREVLGGSKSPMAQALRLVMHEQHKTARQRLRSATHGIHKRVSLPLDAIAQANQQEAARRRYRDILRYAAIHEVQGGIVTGPSDLTSARQAWFTAPLRTQDSGLSQPLHDAIAVYGDDIRADGLGNLLLPHRRQDGGIAGFTQLNLAKSTERDRQTHCRAQGGLILIGPRDATRCLIVVDSQTALAAAVRLRDQPVLIIGVGDHVGQAEATHLQSLTEARNTTIARESDIAQSSVMARLADLLPSARLVRWGSGPPAAAMPEAQSITPQWDATRGPQPRRDGDGRI
ncbi:hypothetical protein [Pseudotabrizicola alkalilacus]|uniref:hypothetical protein n=1 Tax=Pseudotabrizicola alkalilacus TaxID=2305252 RepID=UPI001F1B00DB|nr:hypothetical protein [Pseudotabrizicola alkalilacus]